MRVYRWCRLAGLGLALSALAASALNAAEPDQGFTTVVKPNFTGEELRAQDDPWALQVGLRPMRLAYVQATNLRTGAKSSEIVWYLVFKIERRPVAKPALASDSTPVNVQDPAPPAVCVPKAVLVLEDPDLHGAIVDSTVPEALPIIAARERLDLKTPVQLSGPLPKLTSPDSKHENAEYGVFMFRSVNPQTTAFSVYISGLSNCYKIGKDESGKPMVLRRTIQVPYRRFADRYDQFAKEIRQIGEPKWIYVPDEATPAKK